MKSEEKEHAAALNASRRTPHASRLSIIAAMAKNRAIGVHNTIPWHLPAELKLFKSITMGHHIVMGRNTWESMMKLLPGRTTVIVTHQPEYKVPGAVVVHSLEQAIAAAAGDDEVFVIGGAQLYDAALPVADRIYLTRVDAELEGDTFMPEIDLTQWQVHSSQAFSADEKNQYAFELTIYDRNAA